jgi:integrase
MRSSTAKISKRCSCAPGYDADGDRLPCPRLREARHHGAWTFVVDLGTGPDGRRRQVRRGGFATKAEAARELTRLKGHVVEGTYADAGRLTVATFLTGWLAAKSAAGTRPKTMASYVSHVDRFLTPRLGHLRLSALRAQHIEALLREIAEGNAERARPIGPTTLRRVHATIRSALGSARRQGLVSTNVASNVELPRASRPKARPWSAVELGRFLDSVAADRLGVMFELIALTGLRRGEALGLTWSDVDLERAMLTVRRQLVDVGGRVLVGKPKTASGEDRAVDLDGRTVGTLLAHQLRQHTERQAWGAAWQEAPEVPDYAGHPVALPDLVFRNEDGSPVRPEAATRRFRQLASAAGVRGVRLHDLRHGQASLMLAAGVPLAVVSKRLGHSSTALTADTCSHLLSGVGRQAAEAAAALIPRSSCDPLVTAGVSDFSPV